MNKDLTKRLEEIGITREKILKLISTDKKNNVIIYASCMEGLGTRSSDFDIYIIKENCGMEDTRDAQEHQIKMIDLDPQYYNMEDVPYLYLDVEYWDYITLAEKFERVFNNKFLEDGTLKLLLRLSKGEVLQEGMKNETFENIRSYNFASYVQERFALDSDAALHDCTSLYEAKEYYGAILCGRHALLSAVAGINAKNGFLNINTEKWAMNLFQRSVNISQNEVLELLFGEMRPQREDVKRIIILVQNILNRQLDFLGKKHWINKEEYDMLDESQDILIQI